MLVELAIGDAYGAGFEYAPLAVVREHNDLSGYIQHQKHKSILPGSYTDDTQMTLAIAEALVEDDPWTRETLADRFVDVFKRDERTGYAGRFYDFLKATESGTAFLDNMRPDSEKSGGAMRATPLGLLSNESEVMKRCTLQCSLTHNTKMGIAAANAAALMTHFFYRRRGPKHELGMYLVDYVPEVIWTVQYRGKVLAPGWMSVHAAVSAVERNNSMSALLVDCINYTGDVDTVATIALAAASWSDDYEQDLPPALVQGLEDGKYGRTYLAYLDTLLAAKFAR